MNNAYDTFKVVPSNTYVEMHRYRPVARLCGSGHILINFYDLDEWELIDMKEQYGAPAGIPAPREDIDPMQYYSTQRKTIERHSRRLTYALEN